MSLNKTYLDKYGYLRFIDTDKLVHRWVAYNQIYKKGFFWTPFGHMVVHHKDRNKLNNNVWNLEILPKGKHREEHGIPSTFTKFIRWLKKLFK